MHPPACDSTPTQMCSQDFSARPSCITPMVAPIGIPKRRRLMKIYGPALSECSLNEQFVAS